MLSLLGKRVVVMGLGRFGGGVGVTRFLAARGARVLVTDLAPAEKLKESVARIADLDVELHLGEHHISDFTSADLIVVNPAVNPRTDAFVKAAAAAGVSLTSEIRLLIEQLPNRRRIIGITGSAGKSTTTAMIGHALRGVLGEQRVHVGGNLGGSLLERAGDIRPDDWVVLELSSFMLDGLDQDRWSPHVAVVTNFAPNHLDWHGSVAAYRDAKQVLLRYQQPSDVAILGESVADWPVASGIQREVIAARDYGLPLLVPGVHNQINATMTLRAAARAGLSETDTRQALSEFPGLPHRLQMVAQRNGVRYYNDSKSTTPEAAHLALEAFPPDTVHLICGGYDKGADLAPLARFAAQRCAGIYTIGNTGDAIAKAAEGKATRCGTLDRAVALAGASARSGHVILLSPACASWDQFANYEARGEAFTELVTQPPASEKV